MKAEDIFQYEWMVTVYEHYYPSVYLFKTQVEANNKFNSLNKEDLGYLVFISKIEADTTYTLMKIGSKAEYEENIDWF